MGSCNHWGSRRYDVCVVYLEHVAMDPIFQFFFNFFCTDIMGNVVWLLVFETYLFHSVKGGQNFKSIYVCVSSLLFILCFHYSCEN